MDSLIIIVLVLIGILSLFYLIRNNSLENFLIEKFTQRNSLSTYFQSTENSSNLIDMIYSKNNYNNNHENIEDYNIIKNNKWNGEWKENTDNPLFGVFLIVNDKIIFAISKSTFELDTPFQESEDPECISSTFVGIGSINNSKNKFILKDIICNNLDDDNYTFTVNETYGFLSSDNDCTIYTSSGNTQINLVKKGDFTYSKQSAYLFLSSYINPVPNFKDKYEIDTDVCRNSNFADNQTGSLKSCYINEYGLPTPGGEGVRNYGTGCTTSVEEEDDVNGDQYSACSNDRSKTCFIPGEDTDSVGDYDRCNTEFKINRNYQAGIGHALTKLGPNGNNIKLCGYLDDFFNVCNSAILMYVDNLTDVRTLGYEYFGQKQNSLTTNIDVMQLWMKTNLLSLLRSNLTDENSSNDELEKILRLTNCIENNNSDGTYESLLESCKESLSDKVNNIKQNVPENPSMPVVWKINMNTQNNNGPYNNQNSCTFSLSSSEWYVKESRWRKYAEFDPANNKTGLSLYEGGTNQHLFLENAHVISSYTDDTDDTGSDIIGNYTLISGNLRTSNPKKYLIPSETYSGFKQKSNGINLENKIRSNGKWVILGFSLMKNMDTISPDSLNNSVLTQTLAKIKNNLQNNL